MKIILEGIVGSKAYGLDNEHSDTDIKGIMVYPTKKILSLSKGKETINKTSPDIEYHEIEKFIRLAVKCNPTILEMLFLNKYTKYSLEGDILLKSRNYFLSNAIFNSYGGYALSQAKKLWKKGQSYTRYKKHSRHCFRLLLQGKQLLETGNLAVKLSEEKREYLFDLCENEPDLLLEKFEKEFKSFDKIKSCLPEKPNYEKINECLLKIREMN